MKIEIEHLKKTIKKTVVIDDVNLTLSGGTIYGLCGKNGCGKTMLMRLIAGLIYPTEGKICINGKQLGKDMSFPDSIGLLIENPSFLNDYTGYQNLKLLRGIQKGLTDEDVRWALKRVGLDWQDKRKFYKYSLGMKQRLGIAAAVMGKPEIILLDEPINAIDADGVQEIRSFIREMSEPERMILIACHDKEEMEYLADKKIYMSEGKIVKETGV